MENPDRPGDNLHFGSRTTACPLTPGNFVRHEPLDFQW
jgi:hypothetical protein